MSVIPNCDLGKASIVATGYFLFSFEQSCVLQKDKIVRILLSNDDGIDAPGIKAMEAALLEFADVWVIAPSGEQSAKSHALTMHKPIRAVVRDSRHIAIAGTPVDSVYMAIHHFMPEPPDLVVSGINKGANLGDDIHYSGTVAAAREACLLGFPSLAVSLHLDSESEDKTLHWDTASPVACSLAKKIHEDGLPPLTLINLNVPNIPKGELKGVSSAELGRHHYHPLVEERLDPRGKRYYWLGGLHDKFSGSEATDGVLVERGYASVTPVGTNATLRGLLPKIEGWLEG